MAKTTDFDSSTWDAVHKATELGLLPKDEDVTAEEHIQHGRLMWQLRDFILGDNNHFAIWYESLRKVIDGGAESTTHEDALEACIVAFRREGSYYAEQARIACGKGTKIDAAGLAGLFHDTYERLAPSFGYETRTETRKFDSQSPNGQLMIATCEAVLKEISHMEKLFKE